jgi:hypothetical protein
MKKINIQDTLKRLLPLKNYILLIVSLFCISVALQEGFRGSNYYKYFRREEFQLAASTAVVILVYLWKSNFFSKNK